MYADGWYYSPDLYCTFQVKDGFVYSADGDKWRLEVFDKYMIRSIKLDPTTGPPSRCIDYASYSDEWRSARKAKIKEEEDALNLSRQERTERRQQAIDRAKAKLTEEEYEAIYDLGFEHGRD